MFKGSIPADMRSIVRETVRGWDCSDVYVGCSGNFTIERAIADLGFKIHGNDVTLYSCVIGAYLSGTPLPVIVNPDYEEEYSWLSKYLGSPEDAVATILIASDMVEGLDKYNPYYDRVREAYRLQWEDMHRKTVDKVKAVNLRLKSFASEDVSTWIDKVPAGQGVISFPPFYDKGYSRMFANLEKLFSWPAPHFEELIGELKTALLGKIREKRHWLYAVNLLDEECSEYLVGTIKPTNRAAQFYVYSNSAHSRIALPRQKTAPVPVAPLGSEDIGGELVLEHLSSDQFATLRSEYMNPTIPPALPSLSLAVVAGEKLLGAFAFSPCSSLTDWSAHIPTPAIYLMSDFPVSNTKYKRLSKLILYAVLSKEVKLVAERMERRVIRSIITTAFSDKPVSMKYRGLFDLLTRKKDKVTGEYMLNYGARAGQWTLKEGLELWKQKYATRE